jgi:hypothetical protein
MKRKMMMAAIIAGVSAGAASVKADGDFSAGERFFSVFGSYVDKSGDALGLGAGVTYFITPQIGVGTATHVERVEGKLLDNLNGEAYFRVPLQDLAVAPYGVTAIGYSFETEEMFYSIGGGAEWKLSQRLRAFGDLSWQFNQDSKDGVAIRLGARVAF